MVRRDRGFTLTELMIVISIIGLLAGIIFVSSSTVRKEARDKQRKADVEQIASLLQVKIAQDKILPKAGTYGPTVSLFSRAWDASYDASFVPFLVSENYTTKIPLDPRHPASANYYFYNFFDSVTIGNCRPSFYAVGAVLEGTTGGNSTCFPGASYYVITGN